MQILHLGFSYFCLNAKSSRNIFTTLCLSFCTLYCMYQHPNFSNFLFLFWRKAGSSYFSSDHNLGIEKWCYPETKETIELLLKVKDDVSSKLPPSKRISECDLSVVASSQVYNILQVGILVPVLSNHFNPKILKFHIV